MTTSRRDFLRRLLALGATATAAGVIVPQAIIEPPRRRFWQVGGAAPVVRENAWPERMVDAPLIDARIGSDRYNDCIGRFVVAPGQSIQRGDLLVAIDHQTVRAARPGDTVVGFAIGDQHMMRIPAIRLVE